MDLLLKKNYIMDMDIKKNNKNKNKNKWMKEWMNKKNLKNNDI